MRHGSRRKHNSSTVACAEHTENSSYTVAWRGPRRKLFYLIVNRLCVCWNVFPLPLPSNALIKSVTISINFRICRDHLLSLYITNCMEQSPSWGSDRCTAAQEIPRLFWNLKGQDKSPSLIPVLYHCNWVHVLTPYRPILEMHFSIILPLRLRFATVLFPSNFPTKPRSVLLNIFNTFAVMPRSWSQVGF
jgi:hypothetical protein